MVRTILVTGAAKRLGAIVARELAGRGHRVVIHYGRSRDEAVALAEEIGAAGVVEGDLSDTAKLGEIVAAARRIAGCAIDGLVNSASDFTFDAPPEIDVRLLDRLHAINLSAPVLLTQALAAQRDLVEGAVVNVLDQKIANLNPDYFSYTVPKVALAGATRMLSQALAPRIRVNAVAPGLSLPSGDQTEAEFRAVASENVLRRPVDPTDIGKAVCFLMRANGVRGQTIFVDCGQRFLPRDSDVMFERDRG